MSTIMDVSPIFTRVLALVRLHQLLKKHLALWLQDASIQAYRSFFTKKHLLLPQLEMGLMRVEFAKQ